MKKFLLVIFLLLFTITSAKTIEVTQVDKDIVTYLFKGEWEKADTLIELKMNENPDHPKYYFLKAYNIFYARNFSNNAYDRGRTISLVEHYTWKAIKLGEELEQTTEVKFYIGSAYGFLARANAMKQEFWTAYWNASECENYLEDVLDEDPENIDAQFALGVIEYYPAVFVTGFTGFLTWFGGMSGDRETGLSYITNVAENGNLFKDEAKFALGIIYRGGRENEYEKALNAYNYLRAKYPENNNFANGYNQVNLAMLISNNGAGFLETEFEQLIEKYNISNPGTLNGIGYNLMNQNKIEDAEVVFQINIKLYPHVANGYDSMGECYMNQNKNELAIKYYEMAYEKFPSDTTITEQFRQTVMEGIEERLEELRGRVNT